MDVRFFRGILFDSQDNPLTVSPIFNLVKEVEDWANIACEGLETTYYEVLEIIP